MGRSRFRRGARTDCTSVETHAFGRLVAVAQALLSALAPGVVTHKHNPGTQDAQAQAVEKGETAAAVRSQRWVTREANARTASSASSS